MSAGRGAWLIGLGSSGPEAEAHLGRALAALAAHPHLDVVSVGRFYENPAVGEATRARFVNGAALVDTPVHPAALLRALHAIEAREGRVRATRWGARSLDLDVLWHLDAVAPSAVEPNGPALPHPRFLERPFAVVPALEALAAAGRVPPAPLVEAARRLWPGARLRAVGPLVMPAGARGSSFGC